MQFPKQIKNLIDGFEQLPGIGPKTAERLAFYLLHVPGSVTVALGKALIDLKRDLVLCSVCKNITNAEICDLCSGSSRDKNTICVVESPLDVFSFERSGKYNGLYHVLHGLIDPLHSVGPDELYIDDLIKREADEIILALNPTMEGEATAMYLAKKLNQLKGRTNLKITRLGIGLPIGGDLQYADETTLTRALEGRQSYE